MRSFLISDNLNTLIGMRLAGIEGVIKKSKSEVLVEIDKALKDNSIGIIIITENILSMAEDEIMKIKLERNFPLIVEIPDRNGTKRKDYLMKYIRESIGIKI